MFLYGELSVVISAMAVWMDLKDASVDNGWILFSFMIGFFLLLAQEIASSVKKENITKLLFI